MKKSYNIKTTLYIQQNAEEYIKCKLRAKKGSKLRKTKFEMVVARDTRNVRKNNDTINDSKTQQQ